MSDIIDFKMFRKSKTYKIHVVIYELCKNRKQKWFENVT